MLTTQHLMCVRGVQSRMNSTDVFVSSRGQLHDSLTSALAQDSNSTFTVAEQFSHGGRAQLSKWSQSSCARTSEEGCGNHRLCSVGAVRDPVYAMTRLEKGQRSNRRRRPLKSKWTATSQGNRFCPQGWKCRTCTKKSL